jgi:hypothetical protein
LIQAAINNPDFSDVLNPLYWLTDFPDLFAAYDSVPKEKLWRHVQKIGTPQYLRDIIQTMYTGCLYLLIIDGNNISPNRGLKLEKKLPSESPFVLPL